MPRLICPSRLLRFMMVCDSSVSIVTSLRVGWPKNGDAFRQQAQENVLLFTFFKPWFCGPPSLVFNGDRCLFFPHVFKKRLGRVKLSTQLRLVAEVKNAWDPTYTPPYAIIAWCVIKHRDIPLFVYSFLLKAFPRLTINWLVGAVYNERTLLNIYRCYK